MINDYFGRGSNGNEGAITASPGTHSDISNKECLAGETAISIVDVSNSGKENMESTAQGKIPAHLDKKPKGTPKGSASAGKRGRRNKSLSMLKKPVKEDILEKNNPDSCKVNSATASVQNFSLKIRMKSKNKFDSEDIIEEFTSPEQEKAADDKAKVMKSPQATLLKYFSSDKNSSPLEINTSKPKVNREISDFFSPSKPKKEEICTSIEEKSSSELDVVDCLEIKNSSEIVNNKNLSKPDVTKSAKKPRKKKLCIPKKNEEADMPLDPKSMNKLPTSESHCNKAKSTTLRSKSSKKSLSLANNQDCVKTLNPSSESMEVSTPKVSHADPQPSVVESMSNKLKEIMSKSSSDDSVLSSTLTASLPSKKRKRNDKDGSHSAADLKTSSDDSPVKSRRRLGKTNQISCDSDDDNFTQFSSNDMRSLPSIPSTGDSGVIFNDFGTLKVEESKRNSLMNYFSKVSKQEILANNEKVELKVQALVHSPPTTPSKKVKRRSVNSLPGGAASLNKKKGNLKSKLRENVNAIEVIDVDETKSLQRDDKQQLEHFSEVPSRKVSASKTPKCAPPADIKSVSSSKTMKKVLSRAKEKQVASSSQPCNKPVKSSKDVKAKEKEETKEASLLLSQSSCDIRASVTPQQLPSTRGTLLEEDSDNEEIFSSRREKKRKVQTVFQSEDQDVEVVPIACQKRLSPEVIFEKKIGKTENVKMAPLFTQKANSQARQLFLQSGVPNQIKRVLETQHSFEEQEVEMFPVESHVQQKDSKEWVWKLGEVELPLRDECGQEITENPLQFSFEDLTGCCNIKAQRDRIAAASCKGPAMRPVFGLPVDVVKPILRLIKRESPDFKVANTFSALQTKCREDEFLKADALSALSEKQRPKRKSSARKSANSMQTSAVTAYRWPIWTEKYKPSCLSDIVGNSESVSRLKLWLEAWYKINDDSSKISKEDISRKKKKKKDFIDDEDFEICDNSLDSRHSNLPDSVAVLYGPSGSGKTSTVYALSKDLGFKVLEVNASERRNGKSVLSKLSEATQSHQVQQSSIAEQGFSALFGRKSASVKNKKKKPHPLKRTDSDEEKTKKMSLILFEDVDVVFEEEDEGFLSAITNLVSTSKRPVILTTTDPESSFMNRFMSSSSITLEFSCSQNLQSTWLQIVSLVEGVYVAPETVNDLVFLCKGDFRKALLQMQLWVMSGGNNLSFPLPPIAHQKSSLKSKKGSKGYDNDDISDLEDEDDNNIPSIPANPDCIASMLGKNDVDDDLSTVNNEGPPYVKVPSPLNLGLFWWNVPPLLSLGQLQHAQLPVLNEHPPTSGSQRMLDDSFIASFCTDDGSTNDSATNEDVNEINCQGTGEDKSVESEEQENVCPGSINSASSKNTCSQEEISSLARQMIAVSCIDIISVSSRLSSTSDTEPVFRFSQPMLKDGLALVKEEIEGPNFVLQSLSEDICLWLAEQSLNRTRTSLCRNVQDVHSLYNNCLPSQEEQMWRSLHAKTEKYIMKAVPLCSALERQALATDFFPTFRTFCRLEENKSITRRKTKLRKCPYLKLLGADDIDHAMLELMCRSNM